METFTQIPISINPTTHEVTSTPNNDTTLAKELEALNKLHRALVGPQSEARDGVAPPPTAVNPKRSAQLTKLRDSGNAAFRGGKFADAIKLYSLGIDMALGRPVWEPAALCRDELAGLYSNRAQAHMGIQQWPEGAIDAGCSVELKKNQNPKAWWRKGKCLFEMGRLEEADRWLEEGIEFEGQEQDLLDLLKQVKEAEARKKS
jgi:translocation protein SEC72